MDMLSNLPDPILCHILSFVPTKTSVACSLLSKRWKLLWTFVPVLDLDVDEDTPYCESRDQEDYIRKEKKRHLRFLKIVDKVYFVPREFRLKKLKLYVRTDKSRHSEYYLHKWIKACLFEELDLFVESSQYFKFPKSSHYSNLLVLKLTEFGLSSVESCLFPKLRVLHLSGFSFEDKDGGSLENFLSACPVLEELECKEPLDYFRDMRICVPTLTSLVIDCPEDHKGVPLSTEFVLETPALEYLSCKLDDGCSLVTTSLCNLSKADITCLVFRNHIPYGCFVMKLLKNLSGVEFLKLPSVKIMTYDTHSVVFMSGFVDKFYRSCLDEVPIFDNLVRLELSIPYCDCVLLPHLLHKFHILKHLSIDKVFDMNEVELCWKEPQQVPICLSSTLSSFCFQGFEGIDVEVELVEYVKKHAKVLKNMTLKTSSNFKGFETKVETTHKFWF